ncbi:alpha-S1-casein-like [Peromyscus eremicus]|uniref:alpha-S1-casein-like n=1 Tax=Peromyscus eremicus TaxID=42410 RepID=UPI0027DC5DC8|nr:alpha-S1-casein-like [Peromyscus eremicus]
MEQAYRMNAHNQVQMRQPMSAMDQELAQLFVQAFPQFYQYDAYPFWAYFPQDMQHLTSEAVLNTLKAIVPKNAEETKVW